VTSDERERRAADRRRRRNGSAEAEHVDELRDGLKNAASAAAVGAAVGAARALGARRGRRVEHDDLPQDHDEPAAEAEREPVEPEPEEHDEPIEAVAPGAIRKYVDDARALLRDLVGSEAESVSSVLRTAQGWRVGLIVVEVRRIPDSTDVLATYDVQFDDDGGVLGIERTRRYHRSEADRGGRP
jgi:hypothetical protein